MKSQNLKWIFIISLGLLVGICVYLLSRPTGDLATLRVGIAPYQDLAMLTAYESIDAASQSDLKIELVTLPWEEIQPSLASAGETIDVGFGSLIEFLTKFQNVNTGNADPLVYVFPMYVFKGGGFVSFNKAVPSLDDYEPSDKAIVKTFFQYRIGAQKNSMFDMLLFHVSQDAGLSQEDLAIIDTTMADGLLAAQAGSLDIAAAGLTQRNEAIQRGGRVVLTMEERGFADLTGLICKKSTLERRRGDIEKLIQVWFRCVDYVYSDLENNSAVPLKYLKERSSTQYDVASFKRALEAEYLPRSIEEAHRELVDANGKFAIANVSSSVIGYLRKLEIVKEDPPSPVPIDFR